MTIAIEVPGEAAPLTPQEVYLALQSASSHQQNFIQTGTQQLQTWESKHGYYALLQVGNLDRDNILCQDGFRLGGLTVKRNRQPTWIRHYQRRFDILPSSS